MSLIHEILHEQGPCTTEKLARELCNRGDLSSTAARKRIQRAREQQEILSAPFNLAHNQQFVFLHEHAGTKVLREAMIEVIQSTNSWLKYPIVGTRARGGVVPIGLFPTFSGLPLKAHGNSADAAQEILLDMGILQKTAGGEHLKLSDLFLNMPLSNERAHSRLNAEYVALLAFADWLQLQGMIIGRRMSFRNRKDVAEFGYHSWDFVAPSYTQPLAPNPTKPGFIVADIILGRILDSKDVQYFIWKCTSIRSNKRMPAFLAWLIAERFQPEVLQLARSNGILCTTIKNLFGNAFGGLLDLLMQIMDGKEYGLINIDQMIEKTDHQLSSQNHLKSSHDALRLILLQLLSANALASSFNGSLSHFDTGWDAAIDSNVFQIVSTDVKVTCHCIVSDSLTSEDLDRWRNKFPLQRFDNRESPDDTRKNIHCICTTASIDSYLKQRLVEVINLHLGTDKNAVYDSADIRKLIGDTNQSSFLPVFDRWLTTDDQGQ